MLSAPKREEIDHRTIKLVVGIIAICLATLTSTFASDAIDAISASYYEGGWSQTIFIGFMFPIAAFLPPYNALTQREMILSNVAARPALDFALFPCECSRHPALLTS